MAKRLTAWVPPAAGGLLLVAMLSAAAPAQCDEGSDFEPLEITQDLAPLMHELMGAIASLSDYRADRPVPAVFQLPQYRLEQKVCDAPCNVRAAYVPRQGIFLSGNLEPLREPLDRAALVHELVHYLQQGHAKFIGMDPCQRERGKEVEAFAIQNAYLAAIGRAERAAFYDDFDCSDAADGD